MQQRVLERAGSRQRAGAVLRVAGNSLVARGLTLARAKASKPKPGNVQVSFEYGEDEMSGVGSSFQATLHMLEWPRVCEQVAEFASTHAGKRACLKMLVPEDQRMSEVLASETR